MREPQSFRFSSSEQPTDALWRPTVTRPERVESEGADTETGSSSRRTSLDPRLPFNYIFIMYKELLENYYLFMCLPPILVGIRADRLSRGLLPNVERKARKTGIGTY